MNSIIRAEGRVSKFVGRSRMIYWRDVGRILVPAPGSRPRLSAVARLRKGRFVEIEALWQAPTSTSSYLSTPDHRRAQQALIYPAHDGHVSQPTLQWRNTP